MSIPRTQGSRLRADAIGCTSMRPLQSHGAARYWKAPSSSEGLKGSSHQQNNAWNRSISKQQLQTQLLLEKQLTNQAAEVRNCFLLKAATMRIWDTPWGWGLRAAWAGGCSSEVLEMLRATGGGKQQSLGPWRQPPQGRAMQQHRAMESKQRVRLCPSAITGQGCVSQQAGGPAAHGQGGQWRYRLYLAASLGWS